MFIDDQDGNWTDVYKHHLTCEERRAKAAEPIPVVNGVRNVVGFRV